MNRTLVLRPVFGCYNALMSSKKKNFQPGGKLEDLSSKLYSRDGYVEPEMPVNVPKKEEGLGPEVPETWEDFAGEAESVQTKKFFNFNESTMRFLKKFLIFSLLFFVISVAVAAFVFLRGGNQVSTDNVEITVAGPISVGAGETLTYDMTFTNKNNVNLEGANILIEYPKGARTEDGSQELVRESKFLGDIPAGGTVNLHRQAILFGETNEKKTIIVSIEYRVKDSSATYFKEKNYDLEISTSPVSLTVTSFNEIIAGQEFEFMVEVVSNSSTIINGVLIKADYPFGFEFVSSSPSPSFGNNVFSIGDLRPSEKRIYKIRGKLSGQENEEKNFAFSLGTKDKDNEKMIGTLFVISNQTVAIKRPFISLNLSLEGDRSDTFSTGAGDKISGSIDWTNNLPNRITDLEITAKVSGAFSKLDVIANNGFYRSLDDTILWNKTTNNLLAVVNPSESGAVSFSISSLPTSDLVYLSTRGHTITLVISVRARRFSDTNVPEEVTANITRTIKLDSEIGLLGRSLYFTGPFANQGPIPPTANKNTTYTIIWSLTNTLNTVSDVKVRASLPTYVSWVGMVSPSSESVTYDPLSNEVIWNVGDLKAATGFSGQPREAAFQLSVVPSLSQIGEAPSIIGPASVTGIDRFTQSTIRASMRNINTVIEDAFMYSGEATRVIAQ